MKLPDFGSPSSDSLSNIGLHFSNKAVLKFKSPKIFYKKGALKLIFFNEFFYRKIRMIFDIENSL